MFKALARSLVGRAAGLAIFGAGFWLLASGFVGSNAPQGLLGGAMMLGGMWVMASSRKAWSDGTD